MIIRIMIHNLVEDTQMLLSEEEKDVFAEIFWVDKIKNIIGRNAFQSESLNNLVVI
jgi:hypothetical protein